MKVKSLSRIRLSDPMDCSLPGSSSHGIFQARVLEWGAITRPINFYNSNISSKTVSSASLFIRWKYKSLWYSSICEISKIVLGVKDILVIYYFTFLHLGSEFGKAKFQSFQRKCRHFIELGSEMNFKQYLVTRKHWKISRNDTRKLKRNLVLS